ncbi:MAG: hypothetical protein Q8Q95_03710 [bacterium]|nr:hypothetical protein [bacterium]
MKRSRSTLYLVLLATIFAISCTAGPNSAVGTSALDGNIAGFWLGLWQGMIIGFSFIISLFSDSVRIYETHNNGSWYDWGFVLGIGGLSASLKLLDRKSNK